MYFATLSIQFYHMFDIFMGSKVAQLVDDRLVTKSWWVRITPIV